MQSAKGEYGFLFYDSTKKDTFYLKKLINDSILMPEIISKGLKISDDCSLGLSGNSIYKLLDSFTTLVKINPQ